MAAILKKVDFHQAEPLNGFEWNLKYRMGLYAQSMDFQFEAQPGSAN